MNCILYLSDPVSIGRIRQQPTCLPLSLCLYPKRASERTFRRRDGGLTHSSSAARMISSPDSRNRRVTKSGFAAAAAFTRLLENARPPVAPPGPSRCRAPPSALPPPTGPSHRRQRLFKVRTLSRQNL